MNRFLMLGVLGVALAVFSGGCDDTGGTSNPADTTSQIPGTLQAEESDASTGGGPVSRGAAERETTWRLDEGQEVSFLLDNIPQGQYAVSVRYSNDDDTSRCDRIAVLVDGAEVAAFRTSDTGNWGNGWNVFVSSESLPLGALEGTHTVAFRVTSADDFGVELDAFTFAIAAEGVTAVPGT